MSYHKFKIDLLRVEVMIMFCLDYKDADDRCEWFLNCELAEPSEGNAGYAVARYRRAFIWIGPECKRAQVFHECFHATFQILKQLNCNGQDEELNAHLNEFLCERVLVLWENNNKKRSNVRAKKGRR